MSYQFASKLKDLIHRSRIDLCVIDEAHKLRNLYKKENKTGKAIYYALQNTRKILLTATPLQNSLMELFGLGTLVDDRIFGDEDAFKEKYINGKTDIDDLKERLSNFVHRTLRRDVLEYIKYTNRSAMTMPFAPSEDEQRLYEAISNFILQDNVYSIPKGQRKLLVLVIRKLLASSTYAIIGTLKTIKERLVKLEKGEDPDLHLKIYEFGFEADMLDDLEDELDNTQSPSEQKSKIINLEILRREMSEIDHYIALARQIKQETKSKKLLEALNLAFQTKDKTLIFTESHRTQRYLKEFLEAIPEYVGKIVTFNGQNNEELPQRIYKDWLKINEDTGRITGAKEVDLRQALVDYFKDEAKIMIATEAAAEGMNLQFCSLVVNYDLPWNPQRIEQRIGRCHRYGQKDDVVVINFLNQKNYADQRIYQILQHKFKLFDGVFGASDEILGSLEDGVDFERSIEEILNTCRTKEDIDTAFNILQQQMFEPISKRLDETKKILFENFDEDVHSRLKMKQEKPIIRRSEMLDVFWIITKHILTTYFSDDFIGKYYFNDDLRLFGTFKEEVELGHLPYERKVTTSFAYKLGDNPQDEEPVRTYLMSKAEKKIARLKPRVYRPSTPLGQKVLSAAVALKPEPIHLKLDYTNYPAKISVLDKWIGKKGWILAHSLDIKSFEETKTTLLAGIDEHGNTIDVEVLQKLMKLSHEPQDYCASPYKKEINKQVEFLKTQHLNDLEEKNGSFFSEELDKLDKWADDKRAGLKSDLKKMDAEVTEAKKTSRTASNLPQRLELQKKIRKMELKRDELWRKYDDEARAIEKQKDGLIDDMEKHLKQKIRQDELFTISFEIV